MPTCAQQAENAALKARMTELEQALQGARRTVTQAIEAAQTAQAGQRLAEAQAQQAVQAAQAEAQTARAARAAQAAQFAQAAPTVQSQQSQTGSNLRPGNGPAATSTAARPMQTQRSRSTPAAEHEPRARVKKPRIEKESLSSQPSQRMRATAAATGDSSSADVGRSSAHDDALQTVSSINGARNRTRVAGSRLTALATEGGYLFAAGVDNSLWKRSLSARSSSIDNSTGWEHIGSAVNVIAMATFDRRVYALDSSSSIWRLDLYGSKPTWELWDEPPPPTKQHGIELPERRVSLTTTPDGYIWVATLSNNLLRASANQGANARHSDERSAVCWERVRESVGVSGLVVIPTGSQTLSSKSDCMLIAACEDSKMWHWKPPRAAGHSWSQQAEPTSATAGATVWCSCGATPVKPDRGVAYANGSLYLTGPNGIYMAEVGDVQEGVPATFEWSSGRVPLPPISMNNGAGSLSDRYSPSREEARPQRLGKGPDQVQESKYDKRLSTMQKTPSGNKKTGKSAGGKAAPQKPQVQLKSPDGKEYFEVERILDKRPIQGRKRKSGAPAASMFEYKVKWLNFDKPSDNTWEPWESICNCREVLAAYEATVNGTADIRRMKIGGKKPRQNGVRNTVTRGGFVGGKRPHSSSSDKSVVLSSKTAHRRHGTAVADNTNVGHSGATKSGASSTSTAKRTHSTTHKVQRPRAQRLAKTAALHPSVAAEYQEAEARTGGGVSTVRRKHLLCRSMISMLSAWQVHIIESTKLY